MSYKETIDYIYGLQKHGIKLGLEKTRAIMACLGNPHEGLRSIHVAGTNGKGSVSAMIASILAARRDRVGLFTSPHLVSFTERIRIDNEQITEAGVVALAEEIRSAISGLEQGPTFFEFVTAMAFLHFRRDPVDLAVVETGLGGRLDATNLVLPEVSVITKIGYDHMEFLGNTLEAIASEKAGIIKTGVPVVSAAQEKEALDVLMRTAGELSSKVYLYGRDFSGKLRASGPDGITFDYSDDGGVIENLGTSLAGEHQLSNACLAVKAACLALSGAGNRGGNEVAFIEPIRKGLAATCWRGRLEMVSETPPIMIDGAHNPEAAEALAAFIKKHFKDRTIILVVGIMSDKDIRGILGRLLPVASEAIFTAPGYGRSAAPASLAEHASALGFSRFRCEPGLKEAIDSAIKLSSDRVAGESPLVIITGSFYTLGEAMEVLGEKPVLGTLRESL